MTVVTVVGQVARDLVLVVDELPDAGGAAPVRERHELLGGKGANQGVGCRALGLDVALVGVVGDDDSGRAVLAQAVADGMDVSAVVRRPGTRTVLLVDVVGPPGTRRLLEDVPPATLLTVEDVRAAAGLLRGSDAVLVQLQQPGPAVREALSTVAGTGALVVADGAPADDGVRADVLRSARVVRADDAETAALVGRPVDGVRDAVAAARRLVDDGTEVVALAVGGATDDAANVVAWGTEHVVIPLLGAEPVDPTGGGDAFVSALAAALVLGHDPRTAAWWGSAAAASVVGHPGGRPATDRDRVAGSARRARERHEA